MPTYISSKYSQNYDGQVFGKWFVLDCKYSNTHWFCRCNGCGLERPVQKYSLMNRLSTGCKACNNQERTIVRTEEGWQDGQGYKIISAPSDYLGKQYADGKIHKRQNVFEHIYVMTKHLGRPLTHFETVHHKYGESTALLAGDVMLVVAYEQLHHPR